LHVTIIRAVYRRKPGAKTMVKFMQLAVHY